MSHSWDNLINISNNLLTDLQNQHNLNISNERINLIKKLKNANNWRYYKHIQIEKPRDMMEKMYGECYISVARIKYLKLKDCHIIANQLNILVGPSYNFKGSRNYSFIWKPSQYQHLEDVDYLLNLANLANLKK